MYCIYYAGKAHSVKTRTKNYTTGIDYEALSNTIRILIRLVIFHTMQ